MDCTFIVLFYTNCVFKVLYIWPHIHPFTHSFTPSGQQLPCKVLPTHWRQVGVQCLAQGHFDMLDSWSQDRTANLTVMGWPALPTELQPPHSHISDLLVEYKPSRALRCLGGSQLVEPPFGTKQGENTFIYNAVLWDFCTILHQFWSFWSV